MFRRLPHTLPADPKAATSLEELGYFVTEDDQIRLITNPKLKYEYNVNKNQRVNEISRGAMNVCIQHLVSDRLRGLDLELTRLPIGASEVDRHVPVLLSKNIMQRRRIVVIFGERHQEIGIFSYRILNEETINSGSAVDLVSAILKSKSSADPDIPGIIIANPGQLLWYRGGQRAISNTQWQQLPRKSAVHEAMRIDETKNKVPDNNDFTAHVEYLFEHVLGTLTDSSAKYELIGLEHTGRVMMEYLFSHWSDWESRISSICFAAPQHDLRDLIQDWNVSERAVQFLKTKCRAFYTSSQPLGTRLADREEIGCPSYSSGEEFYEEHILIRGWPKILEWFDVVRDGQCNDPEEAVARETPDDPVTA